ncbi:ABC transporter permease [bacterium]|nr:ABC transporter permease [bacterium]RQV94325.1 MAG: ABC transporter permease [bacterium]
MSLNLLYSAREGIIGLKRARMATAITISTVTISLILLGIFMVLTLNVHRIVSNFRDQMALEVFIDNSLSSEEIRLLEDQITQEEGVAEVLFISKEEALERFREEFGDDPLELLGENPLPPSFQIKIQQAWQTPEGIEDVAKNIERIRGIDEVVYHQNLFRMLDRYSRIIIIVDIVLFSIVLLSAILLVSNTLRLTIYSQRKTIQIMELVGANQSFIRRPYLIQGILQAGVGGCIASLVVWGIWRGIEFRFPHLIEISPLLLLASVFLSLLLGFWGSLLGLKRFLNTT